MRVTADAGAVIPVSEKAALSADIVYTPGLHSMAGETKCRQP